MHKYFKKYLEDVEFSKQFPKLVKKLSGKSVIIYGSGTMFQYICNNYNLEGLNIIGVSDQKFLSEQEGEDFLGFKIIPKFKIRNYNPDYILIATENYFKLIENLAYNFKDTKIKIIPMVRKNIKYIINYVWNS